jgi:hypothetical protein
MASSTTEHSSVSQLPLFEITSEHAPNQEEGCCAVVIAESYELFIGLLQSYNYARKVVGFQKQVNQNPLPQHLIRQYGSRNNVLDVAQGMKNKLDEQQHGQLDTTAAMLGAQALRNIGWTPEEVETIAREQQRAFYRICGPETMPTKKRNCLIHELEHRITLFKHADK